MHLWKEWDQEPDLDIEKARTWKWSVKWVLISSMHVATQLIISYSLVSVLTAFIIIRIDNMMCYLYFNLYREERKSRSLPPLQIQVHVWLLHDGMDQKKIYVFPSRER